jgi:hypothetical protein
MVGLPIGGSIFLIALGAIFRYALNVSIAGVDLDVVGLILMIAGVALLLISLGMYVFSREERVREDYRRGGPPPPPAR